MNGWLHRTMAVAALVYAAAAGSAYAQQGADARFLVIGKEAVLAAGDAAIATDGVQTAEWSPDGRAILLTRESVRTTAAQIEQAIRNPLSSPTGEVGLLVYALGSERAQVVWRAPIGQGRIDRVEWLPGTCTALVQVCGTSTGATDRYRLLRIDGASGSTRVVADQAADAPPELYASPKRPFAILSRPTVLPRPGAPAFGRVVERYLLVTEGGVSARPLDMPDGVLFQRWSADGGTAWFVAREHRPDGPDTIRWFALDGSTGRVTVAPSAPAAERTEGAAPALRVERVTSAVAAPDGPRTIHPLWMVTSAASASPRLLLCADGSTGSVSPDQRNVAYVAQGTAFVARLMRVDAALLQAARDRALTAVAESNAKQVGLAIIMYSLDHDGVLPGAGDLSSSVVPYLKSTEPLSGFVYTYGGGTMTGNPAETEMGYTPTPTGRAVLYGDGHVVSR